jgi:sodium-dependent dicarboxylate transporter 2/3/5
MAWLIAGPATYALLALLAPSTLEPAARHVLGLAGWMALWWVTEPVPLAATSLLPAGLFPALGVASARDAVAPYANELVFLLGDSCSRPRWSAGMRTRESPTASSRRSAFQSPDRAGRDGRDRCHLDVDFDTATAAMMYPIVLAITPLFGGATRDARNTRTALLLGMAYAASIGGMGTLLGTPPNLILAGAARELAGQEVSFLSFLAFGLPLVAILLPLCWALLVFVIFPSRATLDASASAVLRDRRSALGPLRGGELATLCVFAATAVAGLRASARVGQCRHPGLVDLAPRLTDSRSGSWVH